MTIGGESGGSAGYAGRHRRQNTELGTAESDFFIS